MQQSLDYIKVGELKVAPILYNFIQEEVLTGIGITSQQFWCRFESMIFDLIPVNRYLIKKRQSLQKKINNWHKNNIQKPHNTENYINFLREIGYLIPEGPNFDIKIKQIDPELSTICGPQLVVPLSNARYALNAVNARWGSLYDALYGTDALSIGTIPLETQYDPKRGNKVIKWAREFLNQVIPLVEGDHFQSKRYSIKNGNLLVTLENGIETSLQDPKKIIGYQGEMDSPKSIFFINNNLHIQIKINPDHRIGKKDNAHISDIVLESAISTIMDCEDSIAAVDPSDKVEVYRNWLGLMKGNLKSSFHKEGEIVNRRLNSNIEYRNMEQVTCYLKGRSLMLVRNVGHLMTSNAIFDHNNEEIPEGILDATITSLIALHNLDSEKEKNSRVRSIYIVKPKMHGPEEVSFTSEIFRKVEKLLELPEYTIKMGIMDEERRTSVNLKECIRAAINRVVFINTGFLDRTGDEIHTSMQAGPMLRKADIKNTTWIDSYEKQNVGIGLACGFQGRAQIGKGMWPMPDKMANMLEEKISHPESGASTAWVPSPTAATLHSTHYHKINVLESQESIEYQHSSVLEKLLTPPLADNPNWSNIQIQEELDNNAQGILGYVVRWINNGIGCSKVPDINNVGLMEDRATLRISSQHIANWLMHNVCTKKQVLETFMRMATIVDKQNKNDPSYKNMGPNFSNSTAFTAACDLVFKGSHQPNGYTEPILHSYRLKIKDEKV